MWTRVTRVVAEQFESERQRIHRINFRVTMGVFLAIGTGFWSALTLFSDGIGPYSLYVVYLFVAHCVAGVAIGFLTRLAWVALVGWWGGLFWGITPLFLSSGNVNSPWNELVLIPGSLVLGGWIGSRLSRWKQGSDIRKDEPPRVRG